MVQIAKSMPLMWFAVNILKAVKQREFEARINRQVDIIRGKSYSLNKNMMYMAPYYSFGIYPKFMEQDNQAGHLMKWQTRVPRKITLGEDTSKYFIQ